MLMDMFSGQQGQTSQPGPSNSQNTAGMKKLVVDCAEFRELCEANCYDILCADAPRIL